MNVTIQNAINNTADHYKTAIARYYAAIEKRRLKAATVWRESADEYELILQALREKEARENPRQLTLEEVLEHLDEPVWLKYLKEPALSHWGIVEGGSTLDGTQYLYLHGEPGHYCYGESVVAYFHKPKEAK